MIRSAERPLHDLVARYARTHGPFVVEDVAERLGVGPDRVAAALADLEEAGTVTHGGFTPGGVHVEWCDVQVLRRLRQRSLAALRRDVEPVDAGVLARFLPAWHGAEGPSAAADALMELGLDKIRLRAPVHHGDTLYCYSEVLETRDAEQPDAGIVRFRHYGVNQDDRQVFEGERTVLIKRRSHWGDK